MTQVTQVQGFSRHSLARGLDPKTFHLFIFPTEQCNFRCVYCYEDFEIGKMPDWLITATKMLMANKIPKLNKLSLSWFGGEPLLAKRTLFELAEFAYNLATQNDCQIFGDITTNGYLLDLKTLRRLSELKQQSFQISIDGEQEQHDKTRVMRNGNGSFDQIWNNLIAAANSDIKFSIRLRIHISDLNQDSILSFLDRYDNSILGSDSRFKLYFHEIVNLGGDQDVISSLNGKKTGKQMVEALNERYAGEAVNVRKHGHYICYASKPNSLVIRANGRLNKCTVALKDERNDIGQINADGTLTLNNQRYNSWLKGFSTLDSWQMGCPFGYMKNNSTVGDIPLKKVG